MGWIRPFAGYFCVFYLTFTALLYYNFSDKFHKPATREFSYQAGVNSAGGAVMVAAEPPSLGSAPTPPRLVPQAANIYQAMLMTGNGPQSEEQQQAMSPGEQNNPELPADSIAAPVSNQDTNPELSNQDVDNNFAYSEETPQSPEGASSNVEAPHISESQLFPGGAPPPPNVDTSNGTSDTGDYNMFEYEEDELNTQQTSTDTANADTANAPVVPMETNPESQGLSVNAAPVPVPQSQTGDADVQPPPPAAAVANLPPPSGTEQPGTERRDLSAGEVHAAHDQHAIFAPLSPAPTRVIYNRVGKCGSTTVLNLLKGLSIRNHFNFHSSVVYRERQLTEADQKELVDDVMSRETPLMYERHFYHINFTKFGLPDQTFINVIRDPLERILSSFYFRRLETRHVAVNKSIVNYNMTYDECVLGGYVCVRPKYYFRIITFFCGQEDMCGEPTRMALQKAKQNVVRHYPVVGVLEDLDRFFTVLEYLMPSYFKDARKIYIMKQHEMREKYQNSEKIPIKEATKKIMLPLLTLEYEFFHWIRQRIDKQFKTAIYRMRKRYPDAQGDTEPHGDL